MNLDDTCLMKKGQRFSVVAQLTTNENGAIVYHVPAHRDVNESAIKKYGKAVTSYVTGVVNEGESYVKKGGEWKDWSEAIAEGKAAGAKLEAEGVKDLNAAIGKQDGALNPYYDYDNVSLKAFADAATAEPVAAVKAEGKAQARQEQTTSVSQAKIPKVGDVSVPSELSVEAFAAGIVLLSVAYGKLDRGRINHPR